MRVRFQPRQKRAAPLEHGQCVNSRLDALRKMLSRRFTVALSQASHDDPKRRGLGAERSGLVREDELRQNAQPYCVFRSVLFSAASISAKEGACQAPNCTRLAVNMAETRVFP